MRVFLSHCVLLLTFFLVWNQVAVLAQNRATFYVGHSLIYHSNTDYPNVNHLAVPYWMNQMSPSPWYADGDFLRWSVPVRSNWRFQPDISIWQGSFENSGYDSIVYTDLNYVQWQPPTANHWEKTDTPISVLVDLIDYVNDPNIPIYIYECWNDGLGLPDQGTATNQERDSYYASTDFTSDYHQWWVDLYEAVIAQRPNANVQLVPIGPILVEVLRSDSMSSVTFTELFEDNAPHGRPTIYLLASIILYTGMTGNRVPSSFTPSNIETGVILSEVIDNFDTITSLVVNQFGTTKPTPGLPISPPTPTPPTGPTPTAPTGPTPTAPSPTRAPVTPPTGSVGKGDCCDSLKSNFMDPSTGCSTVNWCNERIEHCEGDCQGKWIPPIGLTNIIDDGQDGTISKTTTDDEDTSTPTTPNTPPSTTEYNNQNNNESAIASSSSSSSTGYLGFTMSFVVVPMVLTVCL